MLTKNISILIVSGLLMIGIASCNSQTDSVKSQQSHPQMMAGHGSGTSHTMVNLPTVQCGMCEETIETGLKKIKGINSTDVDIEKKVAHINYNPEEIDIHAIEKAISRLGYQANETIADANAYEKLPNCCKLPEDQN